MRSDLWNRKARIAVVAAHPDDETIGMGAQLAGCENVTLIHTTDGAPRRRAEWKAYAQTRRAELLRAASMTGIAPDRCLEVALPDQQASHHLVELACHFSRLFERIDPQIIFTHPYEGGHPDHDATAFAVHHAAPLDMIYEFSSYHRAVAGTRIETGCFRGEPGTRLQLGESQRSRKRRMLACFASQRETLAWFGVDHECFRRAPEYDFTRPPHEGPLFYDFFDWGCDSSEWLRRSRHASKVMGVCLSR